MATMRVQASRKEDGSSARMTPRLADRPRGFRTQGYPTPAAGPSGPPASGKAWKRGTGTPAAWSACRWESLLAVRRAAAGGLRGSPSRSAASAAITAVPSSTGTMPAISRAAASRPISSAAASGFR